MDGQLETVRDLTVLRTRVYGTRVNEDAGDIRALTVQLTLQVRKPQSLREFCRGFACSGHQRADEENERTIPHHLSLNGVAAVIFVKLAQRRKALRFDEAMPVRTDLDDRLLYHATECGL